jgi:hypothetical protein
MFGRFVTHRGWEGKTAGAGLVFRWPDCEPLLDGLDAPHTPRFVDGSWLVCNSNRNELLRFDESGRNIEARLELRSWPRGIAVRDGHLFVGESAECGPDNVGEATIAGVDLDEWKVVDRVEAPVREIYDLVFVPRSLADGIATGFSANSSLQWHSLTGMPLGSSDLRVSVEARIPAELPSATTIYVDCEIENLGSACLISAPPNPVHASYRWLTLDGAPLPAEAEPSRTPLPVPLHPGAALPLPVLVRTPVATGPHLLRITLVQEGVSWFDELEHSSCAEASVVLRGPNG